MAKKLCGREIIGFDRYEYIYIFLNREIFNYLNFLIFALQYQYRKDFSVENIFVEIFNIFFYQYHFIFAYFF